ncbi:MAG: hypothetical protein K2J34_05880, partial [Muribaculaceae bacterium]|nr:hypothetical protein [Muribaculaceae bacterium]
MTDEFNIRQNYEKPLIFPRITVKICLYLHVTARFFHLGYPFGVIVTLYICIRGAGCARGEVT